VASWTLCRSQLPDLLAASMVAASGSAGMTADGWLWWAGAAAATAGTLALVVAARRPPERLLLTLGEPVRLHRLGQGGAPAQLLAEGKVAGSSVITPWLLTLRIEGGYGQGHADVVVTAGGLPATELRRLRMRLLGQSTRSD
jgi:hypothetical protein